jgi:hypothetical protein
MAVTVDVTGVTSGAGAGIKRIISNSAFRKYAANACAKAMQQYVPKRSGNLRESAVAGDLEVTYNMPYAARHFYGFGDGNRTTPGTMSHWNQGATVASETAQSIQQYIKGL